MAEDNLGLWASRATKITLTSALWEHVRLRTQIAG